METPSIQGKRSWVRWFRLLGPLLLIVLLVRLDIRQIYATISNAELSWIFLSAVLIIPLMALKTVRWQGILSAQSVRYPFWPAFIAYFASLFVGFLTPGRLGEFTKALYVWRDCNVPLGRAFSGVLADRLFDLFAVLAVSIFALAGLYIGAVEWAALVGSVILLVGVMFLFLNQKTYAWVQRVGLRFGILGSKFFAEDGWLTQVHLGLRQLGWLHLFIAALWTVIAYGLYFYQCFLLALALRLPVSFIHTMCAVALGGLVTLIPISISGLGTREAAITAYLGFWGVSLEAALSFSLLVFATFYLFGSLIGAVAWWLRPTPYRAGEPVDERWSGPAHE